MSTILEPPRTLPVEHLSVSSVSLFLKCPEKWRRRYIENEFEPSSGALVIGSAVHAAEGENYSQKMLTQADMPEADVLDRYADEFEERAEREDVDWGEDKPGKLKDTGAGVLAIYHRVVAPTVKPVSVERKVELGFEGVDWKFRGYLDVEEEGEIVSDLKVKARAPSKADIESDIQATAALLARREEARSHPDGFKPATEFRFHALVKVQAPELKHVPVLPTRRTDAQLDAFVDRLFNVAAEMAWRVEYDVWDGIRDPGSWLCSHKFCGFYSTCKYGGAR